MLYDQDQLAQKDNEGYSMKEAEIKSKLESTRSSFAYESINKKNYSHMIATMKQDLQKTMIETNRLEDGIRKRRALLENEKLEYNKVKVEKYRAQSGLDQMTRNVEEDQKKTQAKVEQLTKQINEKTQAVSRRLQRMKHQQMVKEAARTDQTDQNENKLRDQLLIYKFWNTFLRRKMERKIQNNSDASEAFEKIRASTGLEDFQEIVKKFLSRENTYTQLLEAVTEAERQKEKVKQENETLIEELREKRIELDGLLGKNEESEVYKLKKEIDTLSQDEQGLLEKYQRCSIVYDQLRKWVLKIYNVLFAMLKETGKHPNEEKRLRGLDMGDTEKIFVEMCGVIEELIGVYGDVPANEVTVKALVMQDDYYNDNEYRAKNIRVKEANRPVLRRQDSSRSRISSAGNPPNPSQSGATGDIEKEQKEINSEFRDERRIKRGEIRKQQYDQKGKKIQEKKPMAQSKVISATDPFGVGKLEAGRSAKI
eukprot:TRINITY_DN2163_c0_g1_i1.p1 TRINITY_DN2163_c0_g1~~TRINITY_DN2163_c0_g1_i1.p1  ORF type:complete len:482 (-),score=210.62 TRINITY_DN2163_c0_g1_i1:203-1648(-)